MAEENPLDAVAEGYVRLVLAVGQHDGDYVDAYYGPEALRAEATAAKQPLDSLRTRALELAAQAVGASVPAGNELAGLRRTYLARQLQAAATRVEMLGGRQLSFDQESRALYDGVVPPLTEDHFEGILRELGGLLPGGGSLVDRYLAFRSRFVVAPERLETVFAAAIDECRRRTQQHLTMPEGETFTVEQVKGKSWNAYNWYQGSFRSLIQVNTDLPITVDRAVDLAAHEGYPGHHVYNALLEKHLVRDRGWVEFTVYPLFSPQSLIAEGTANYGIDVAFPGAERVAFERDVLFPLAGLDQAEAERFRAVQAIVERLDFARVESARRYLDGRIDREAAAAFLERYALQTPQKAPQQVRFFDQYRSYIINYNYGLDLVRRYIEGRGGTAQDPQRRWDEFMKLLASPRLPGGLRA
jgi:hypothetical protein